MIATPLAELLQRLTGTRSPVLERIVTQVCEALEQGHVCLPLSKSDDLAALRVCSAVGAPGEFKPLILDGELLYLSRYWRYENELAKALITRASAPPCSCDEALLSEGIARYLSDGDEFQRMAAENAVRRNFSVITGGPGTGKTRTATIALALIAEQYASRKQSPRFALAAPTGKAAARLKDSLAHTLSDLHAPESARRLLPTEASTIHRLLGSRPSSTHFRHDSDNPLHADVVVVDEASMVDLQLMAKFLTALRPDTRVLLLGDPNQLASVEAGHVLGDICAGPLNGCITELVKNHRFPDTSAIYCLSRAINSGDESTALSLLNATAQNDDLISAQLPLPSKLAAVLRERAVAGYRTFLAAATPQAALEAFGNFRILCAVREGPYGVANLNRLAEQSLSEAGLIENEHSFYHGRPVLILRNDYQLRLYNGDIGLILRDDEGSLRAYFPDDEGDVRAFAPARLPEHETAFAMTIHKTQGSEFNRVLIVLPDKESPILSRELLYTAVTRAKSSVELWWNDSALRAALAASITRWSGLRSRLHV